MKKILLIIGIVYLVIMNITGMASMCLDKSRAQRKMWRVPEKVLFLIAALGGSIGSIAGMYMFRHKTKHWYFVIGMPAILCVQVALLVFLFVIL